MTQQSKLYYTIGEVAQMFDVSTSLIRYWESEFSILRPKKNKKGNRLFTARDVRYLHIIYNLVKVKGYTLQGARDAIKHNIDELDSQAVLLDTLHKTRVFLQNLDAELARRAKELYNQPN